MQALVHRRGISCRCLPCLPSSITACHRLTLLPTIHAVQAADGFSAGDVATRSIRRDQNWAIMPFAGGWAVEGAAGGPANMATGGLSKAVTLPWAQLLLDRSCWPRRG